MHIWFVLGNSRYTLSVAWCWTQAVPSFNPDTRPLENWRLETGNWKLETGNWRQTSHSSPDSTSPTRPLPRPNSPLCTPSRALRVRVPPA
ncbi:hypothetical protein M3J09_012177 [Ascochyta lentis]